MREISLCILQHSIVLVVHDFLCDSFQACELLKSEGSVSLHAWVSMLQKINQLKGKFVELIEHLLRQRRHCNRFTEVPQAPYNALHQFSVWIAVHQVIKNPQDAKVKEPQFDLRLIRNEVGNTIDDTSLDVSSIMNLLWVLK
jgi:hypothetical protein